MKLLKQELDLLPKDTKKESLRKRKEEKEIELADKVVFFFLALEKKCFEFVLIFIISKIYKCRH